MERNTMDSLMCLLLCFAFLKFALRNKKETQRKVYLFCVSSD